MFKVFFLALLAWWAFTHDFYNLFKATSVPKFLRWYLDFTHLYQLHQAKAYFVTRAKKNFKFQRRYSHGKGG